MQNSGTTSSNPPPRDCSPDQENEMQAMIRHHLDGGVEWHTLSEYFADERQSCIDGRDSHAVIGTPGGDMGMLVKMLAVLEQMLGRSLTETEISDTFSHYLSRFGRFYLHSDEHALAHLGEKLGEAGMIDLDNRSASTATTKYMVAETEKIIRQPQEDQKPALLDLLTKPENIGCGHLKLMLMNEGEYRVRPDLLITLMKSFFIQLWEDADKVDFVVLPGEHTEKLVLLVHVEGELEPESLVPAVQPLVHKGGAADSPQDSSAEEFFIVHPEVVKSIYQHVAAGLIQELQLEGIEAIDHQQYLAEVEKLGNEQLGLTKGYLAPAAEIWEAVLAPRENGQTEIGRINRVA
jgi:hypothetical protein